MRIKSLRNQLGLSQKIIAEELNIALRTYEYYETEKSTNIPEYKNLIKLSNFFNCSVDYLLCLTDNPIRNL